MLHIIFWEPEIPGNTGAAIRLSACTGSMLHLVKPLGFDMDDAKLRRAGLDYHDLAHVRVHDSLDEALAEVPGRVWALTGHATTMYSDVSYADGDGLLFGRESVGLSEDAMHHPRVEDRVRIQMVDGVRSLNLANSASIVLYEAWRSWVSERHLAQRQRRNERGPGRITPPDLVCCTNRSSKRWVSAPSTGRTDARPALQAKQSCADLTATSRPSR